MKIEMIKVYRGKDHKGKYQVVMPGEEVTGDFAKQIHKNHPKWCKVLKEGIKKKGSDK